MIVRIVPIVPVVSKNVQAIGTIIWKHFPDDRRRSQTTRTIGSLTIGAIVKNQKRSNGNTLRRSKSIPESIIPVTIFRAFARRLPWSSRIFTKMAATSELNSSLFMEEVQKYECLYNKFSKDYKNKFTRLNCWRKIGEKFDVDAAVPSWYSSTSSTAQHWKNKQIARDEIRSSINIRHFVCESRAKVLLSGPGILLTTVSSHSLGRSRRSFGNQRSPQSSRSSQSSQKCFETTGTIETIRTIIWKPGFISSDKTQLTSKRQVIRHFHFIIYCVFARELEE